MIRPPVRSARLAQDLNAQVADVPERDGERRETEMGFGFFSQINGAERRSAPRRRVLFRGKIVHGPGFTAECAIRNLSDTGAGVKLPEHMASPQDFHLIVVRDGVAHRARTQWTRYPHAGVAFESSRDLADAAAPKSLKLLWAALSPRGF